MTPTFVILAGGTGKRFKPLTIDKTLVPILGKPVLQHTLEMIERVGGTKVIIATNESNQVWLSTYNSPQLEITTVKQPQPLGMGDAVLNLAQAIGSQPVVIMNAADMVSDQLLTDLIKKTSQEYALVTGKKMETYFPGGYLEVEGERVISVVEKPGEGNQPSDLVKLVFDYFSQPQDFIEELRATNSDQDDTYEKAFAKLMQKHQVGYVPYEGYWQALKYSFMLLDVSQLLLKKKVKRFISPTSFIADTAVILGDVYIDDDAKVYEHAVIKGPAYIGKNAVVGDLTLVRESVVESGAVVGFGSEVTRSYVGPQCFLHHNYIGDSVLESQVNPSYGTVTTNVRLDKQIVTVAYADQKVSTNREKFGCIIADNAFLGVNCCIMPGVTIGANARVFPNTTIFSSVPADSVVKTQVEK